MNFDINEIIRQKQLKQPAKIVIRNGEIVEESQEATAEQLQGLPDKGSPLTDKPC